MSFIEVKDIHKTYNLGEVDVPVLKGVSVEIESGELVALMGASGSGKTTLMNILGGLDQPTSGDYRLDGVDMTRLSRAGLSVVRNRHIGFVFQSFNLLPRATALENVLMPSIYSTEKCSGRRWKTRGRELLESVGLKDRMDHTPVQLSGGEQQRVAIARSLVNRPRLLLADEPTGNLDSKTGKEILELFRTLNTEQGITILLVTHDPGVAEFADRTVRIADGLLVDDGRGNGKSSQEDDGESSGKKRTAGLKLRRSLLSLKPIHGSINTALSAMRRNLLRTVLTMLGVIIGVAAVVAVMEVSQGASEAIKITVESMGANTMAVRPGSTVSAGVSQGGGSAMTLTPDDAMAIQRECPAVSSAAPIVWTRVQLVNGNRNWVPADIVGTTPSFLDVRNWTDMELGREFTVGEVRSAAKVCLLGQTVVKELFGDAYPIGEEIRVQNVPLKVVGVLGRKGANLLGADQDDVMIAPWTTIKYRISGDSTSETRLAHDRHSGPKAQRTVRFENVSQVSVEAHSADHVVAATEQITELLRQRHMTTEEDDDFRIQTMAEISAAMNRIVRLLSTLVLIVACFALVVGGVGIMNIMLVSVTERTREIGLRMAVGAAGRDILRQFLIEAVVLCVAGGLLGIAVGHGVTIVVGMAMNWPAPTSMLAAVVALVVSAAVGVAFGYYPAWKASRLNPIDALRYE